jgi:hypothetical protein
MVMASLHTFLRIILDSVVYPLPCGEAVVDFLMWGDDANFSPFLI